MALLARASGNNFHFSNKCFYKFSLNFINFKLYNKFSSFRYSTCLKNTSNIHRLSTAHSFKTIKKKKFVTFDDLISQRRDQARRSIVVQVHAESSSYELYDYCSQIGTIEEMHHYTLKNGVHFVLIEFNSLSDIESICDASTHINTQQNPPVTSPLFWFRAVNGGPKKKPSKQIPLKVTNGKYLMSNEKINKLLCNAESVSDQMSTLCKSIKLSDTDIRLRFISARQIESCFAGMFPNISVLPFGSSVNGFGKNGCDLDLVLKLQTNTRENPESRLVYHTKSVVSNDRIQAQKIMETISDVMYQFLPGITSIRKILRARVPIIKYHQTLTGLECDLSMTNTIGIHMSELLYIFGELDSRVRPLIFTIRMWAQNIQLTNNTPGSWITNFSLTLLGLFYLQQKEILPSLQHLVELASKNDVRVADDCVDCTFLRDISMLPKPFSTNKETLEELLTNFFIYYASFDFVTKAISLNEGKPLNKPKESNVFIFNPFEQGLNVTKNMNIQETQRLKIEMRNAAWLFDSAAEIRSRDWGLLSLFRQKVESTNTKDKSSNTGNRIVELSTFFKNPVVPTAEKVAKNEKNSSPPSTENQIVSISTEILPNSQQLSKSKKRSNRRHLGKR